AGQHEYAGADNTADPESDEIGCGQRAPQGPHFAIGAGVSGFCQKINDGFSRPNVGQRSSLRKSSRLNRSVLAIRNKHYAAMFPQQVALSVKFWQKSSSAAPQGGSDAHQGV